LNDTPLKKLIVDHLRRTGRMTFERYMALCLYHPEFGYYTQACERTGLAGDYFTSSDLHPVFARLIARQAAEMWVVMGRPQPFTWVEMGAGRGLFAADFVSWAIRELPEFAAALDYVVIEPGERRRQGIESRLAEVGIAARVRKAATIEDVAPVTGCCFSNELVDAFSVHLVTRNEGRLKEIYVTANDGELGEKLGPISDTAVAAYVARYAPELEENHRVEVNRQAAAWVHAVSARLNRGYVLTIDYGDLAKRLYAPDRPRGTLLAFHNHIADEQYFAAPGETDLTSHVNFTALIDAGNKDSLEFAGLTTQEKFLMALGEANQFADAYDSGQSEAEWLNARLKLKRLISPEGMGNTFKVLLQRRGVPQSGLTGWKFAHSSP
jgi:SAM-dependent MidA family methyltransferase